MENSIVFLVLAFLFNTLNNNAVDAQGALQCDDHWHLYRPTKMCYRSFNDKVSWDVANLRCERLKANLATVHSQFENNFLLQLSGDEGSHDPWIGLMNNGNGDFSWIDGSSVDFKASWMPNHPMKQGNNCVQIINTRFDNKNGYWYDTGCAAGGSSASDYICMQHAGITKN